MFVHAYIVSNIDTAGSSSATTVYKYTLLDGYVY